VTKKQELLRRLLALGPSLEPQAKEDLAWLLASFEEQDKQMEVLRAFTTARRDPSLAHYVEDRLTAFDRRLTLLERRFSLEEHPDAEATLHSLVSSVRRLDERVSAIPEETFRPQPVMVPRSTVPSPVRPPPIPPRRVP
jgi:hypothetical protein